MDGNSATISYGYDHRGLMTSVSYPTGTGISYTLDVTGQRTAMTDAVGSTSFTIDGAGRTTGITTPNGTVGYAFDTANRRTSMSLTGTGTWNYSYDAGNRLTQIVNPASETSSFSYDAANRQTGQTNGDGSTVVTTFDNANRPTDILHQTSTGTTLAEYQYSYDGVSNVSTWTDSDGTVTSLGYDASDQLTSEVRDNSHSTGYSLAYTYDHNSNRLTKVVGTGGGAVTTTNTYGTHDQLLTSGSKSYGYDYNGNCTSVTVGTSVTSISYDYENRVVGISYPGGATNSFAYNGDDMRMQKVDSAGTANYVCDGTAPASAVLSDSSAIYTPGLSERRSSTSKFYHGDNLGSTRGITNSSQTVTDAIRYDAFGNTISRTGTTPTPFGFVGKGQYQTDNDSGLQLLGHRYYDASVGRFISSDPAQAGNNWYAYCDNNPIHKADPEGLMPGEKWDPVGEGPWITPPGSAWNPVGYGRNWIFNKWGTPIDPPNPANFVGQFYDPANTNLRYRWTWRWLRNLAPDKERDTLLRPVEAPTTTPVEELLRPTMPGGGGGETTPPGELLRPEPSLWERLTPAARVGGELLGQILEVIGVFDMIPASATDHMSLVPGKNPDS